MEKFSSFAHKYLCLLPDNLAKCGVDYKQHKCSSERKISSVMLLEQDLQKTGMGFMVFETYLPEFLSKLVEKLASFTLYRCCGEMCRRQSTTGERKISSVPILKIRSTKNR